MIFDTSTIQNNCKLFNKLALEDAASAFGYKKTPTLAGGFISNLNLSREPIFEEALLKDILADFSYEKEKRKKRRISAGASEDDAEAQADIERLPPKRNFVFASSKHMDAFMEVHSDFNPEKDLLLQNTGTWEFIEVRNGKVQNEEVEKEVVMYSLRNPENIKVLSDEDKALHLAYAESIVKTASEKALPVAEKQLYKYEQNKYLASEINIINNRPYANDLGKQLIEELFDAPTNNVKAVYLFNSANNTLKMVYLNEKIDWANNYVITLDEVKMNEQNMSLEQAFIEIGKACFNFMNYLGGAYIRYDKLKHIPKDAYKVLNRTISSFVRIYKVEPVSPNKKNDSQVKFNRVRNSGGLYKALGILVLIVPYNSGSHKPRYVLTDERFNILCGIIRMFVNDNLSYSLESIKMTKEQATKHILNSKDSKEARLLTPATISALIDAKKNDGNLSFVINEGMEAETKIEGRMLPVFRHKLERLISPTKLANSLHAALSNDNALYDSVNFALVLDVFFKNMPKERIHKEREIEKFTDTLDTEFSLIQCSAIHTLKAYAGMGEVYENMVKFAHIEVDEDGNDEIAVTPVIQMQYGGRLIVKNHFFYNVKRVVKEYVLGGKTVNVDLTAAHQRLLVTIVYLTAKRFEHDGLEELAKNFYEYAEFLKETIANKKWQKEMIRKHGIRKSSFKQYLCSVNFSERFAPMNKENVEKGLLMAKELRDYYFSNNIVHIIQGELGYEESCEFFDDMAKVRWVMSEVHDQLGYILNMMDKRFRLVYNGFINNLEKEGNVDQELIEESREMLKSNEYICVGTLFYKKDETFDNLSDSNKMVMLLQGAESFLMKSVMIKTKDEFGELVDIVTDDHDGFAVELNLEYSDNNSSAAVSPDVVPAEIRAAFAGILNKRMTSIAKLLFGGAYGIVDIELREKPLCEELFEEGQSKPHKFEATFWKPYDIVDINEAKFNHYENVLIDLAKELKAA
jgi:hypothetical protein|nr:MAG TPA: hypothetical protein [Ackermannviridae sp.]